MVVVGGASATGSCAVIMLMHSYRGKDRLPVWILGLKESAEVLVSGVNSGWGPGARSYSGSRSLRLRQFVGPSVVKSAESLWQQCWLLVPSVAKAAGVLCRAIYWGLWWGPQ